ncbi:MAG: hypothetical protein Q4A09_07220 [Capnocytophaga felis]|nr:hypothetical protein [Capnocytophaga felis]
MQLYSIDVRRPKHNADSDRGRQRGLKSPHGRRGAICSHFGWTWHYLHEGIAWSLVQRMMIDAPSYETEDDENEDVALTDENAEYFLNYFNQFKQTPKNETEKE